MKIFLYKGSLELVEKSGVGKAIHHQEKAMKENNIPYTSNKKDHYDVIQLNTIFLNSVFQALLAKLKGKKVVYYGHSTMEDFKNSFKGSNLLAPLFKKWIIFCYCLGDVIITPTEYSQKLLKGYGIKKPIFALSNGIDLTYFKRSGEGARRFREKYNLSEDKKVVMSVGHYMERKGVTDFVKLAERMPEVCFIWFGFTNPSIVPADVKKAIENAPKNVLFPGYINSDELRDAYSGSDLFLFLTHEETEGIVLLEALAMEIPVLIRDIPIYREMFLNRNALYKGSTLEEFQDKVNGILDGTLPSLKETAYEFVKEKDIKLIGEKLKVIYKQLEETNGNVFSEIESEEDKVLY